MTATIILEKVCQVESLLYIRQSRARFKAEDNIIIGNVALYGATSRKGIY